MKPSYRVNEIRIGVGTQIACGAHSEVEMKRKLIPIIMMLVSGVIICLFTMVRRETLLFRMTSLLGAMLLFYGLGWVLYSVLNYFDRENEKRLAAETALPEEDEAVEGESESATIE